MMRILPQAPTDRITSMQSISDSETLVDSVQDRGSIELVPGVDLDITSSTFSPPSHVGASKFPSPLNPTFAANHFRFTLSCEDISFTVDISSCTSGTEVLRKVLKECGNPSAKGREVRRTDVELGALSVDGWGLFVAIGSESDLSGPLSEAEILAVCHAPRNHPIRDLVRLCPTGLAGSSSLIGDVNDSSSSIQSSWEIPDVERALDPSSPTTNPGTFSAMHRRKWADQEATAAATGDERRAPRGGRIAVEARQDRIKRRFGDERS
ncbi:hypothetical protein C8F04DRAFT_1094766 [Mycena alexandri]|uniref:Ras-binding domain-containing protein n=1 Tax=Mycena alexandri TaxID=1745969 RepID=A0AAD6SZ80_9AGAR|nr:hypothetical protein C8F04DRAFT_1094766 [Mycena alexandri]